MNAVPLVVKRIYTWTRALLRTTLFDRRYGVETDRVMALDDAGISDPDSVFYMASGLWSLRRILPRREVTDTDVFIDFGSGKGRVVLQAAFHYPFRRVYGVELSERLHEIASRNVERNRDRLRGSDVRLIRADATRCPVPDDVTVAYLYNPFTGDAFATVVRELLESLDRRPRTVRIIYGNPVEEACLLGTGRVRQVRGLRGLRPGRQWSESNAVRLYEAR